MERDGRAHGQPYLSEYASHIDHQWVLKWGIIGKEFHFITVSMPDGTLSPNRELLGSLRAVAEHCISPPPVA